VLNRGALRGVGVVADLIGSVKGKVEIMWHGTAPVEAMKGQSFECHVVGDTVRAVVSEADVDKVIDILRQHRAKLVAVTPMRTTLEDYFMAKLQSPAEVAP